MNKKFLYMLLLLVAQETIAANILTSEDAKSLLKKVSLDEFNSAISNKPEIAYDRYGYHTVFSATTASPLMEFSGPNSSMFDRLEFLNNDTFKQGSVVASDISEQWRGINTLTNPYVPGGTNVTVEMAVQEHTETYTETATTTTTCGWKFGAEAGIMKLLHAGNATVEKTFTVTAEVNGSTTDTIETSKTYADKASSFKVPVPAGCKAVVTQTLGKATFAGDYQFSNALNDNANLLFNVGNGSANKHSTYTGYVKIVDLINNGDIPQNALKVESGIIYIVGNGKYTANAVSSYETNITYEEAVLGTHICTPPSYDSFRNALTQNEGMRTSSNHKAKSVKIVQTQHGFNFQLPEMLEDKKLLSTKHQVKPNFRALSNPGSTAQCWAGFGSGDLL